MCIYSLYVQMAHVQVKVERDQNEIKKAAKVHADAVIRDYVAQPRMVYKTGKFCLF